MKAQRDFFNLDFGKLSLNLSLYLHAKSDILEDIGNALHEASAGIVVVGFVSTSLQI